MRDCLTLILSFRLRLPPTGAIADYFVPLRPARSRWLRCPSISASTISRTEVTALTHPDRPDTERVGWAPFPPNCRTATKPELCNETGELRTGVLGLGLGSLVGCRASSRRHWVG